MKLSSFDTLHDPTTDYQVLLIVKETINEMHPGLFLGRLESLRILLSFHNYTHGISFASLCSGFGGRVLVFIDNSVPKVSYLDRFILSVKAPSAGGAEPTQTASLAPETIGMGSPKAGEC